MHPQYISQNKKFYWKVIVCASLIDRDMKCKHCNGVGQFGGFRQMSDDYDDYKCSWCDGTGLERWSEPYPDPQLVEYMQKQLDKYIFEYEDWKKANPDFIGMGL